MLKSEVTSTLETPAKLTKPDLLTVATAAFWNYIQLCIRHVLDHFFSLVISYFEYFTF